MDQEQAELLERALGDFGNRPFDDLASLVNKPTTIRDVIGRSGKLYQLELQVFWDDRKGGDIRVVGNIDDGGVRAFKPASRDRLIKAPSPRRDG